MSAIAEDGAQPLRVLITLHEGMDSMDAVGPLEVFANAQHEKNKPGKLRSLSLLSSRSHVPHNCLYLSNPSFNSVVYGNVHVYKLGGRVGTEIRWLIISLETKAFQVIFAAAKEHTTTKQGASFRAQITYEEAMKRLSEIDLLVVPGGGTEAILKAKAQPLQLIKAFAELQKKNPNRERSLMSVCTGAFFLAETGILSGLSATTHPDWITKLEILCSTVAMRDMADRCDVLEERYVVNNLRFELGENEDENPYIMTRKEYKDHKRRKSSALSSPIEENGSHTIPPVVRRPSAARKGSISLKQANTRRESVIKRSTLRLGGLRVLTTSGVSAGIDGALYMVGALVSDEAAEEVARGMCYEWKKGVVVDGTDV